MHSFARAGVVFAGTTTLVLGVATLTAGHIVKQVGPYSVAIGWAHEPTYVGEQNAVQVVIKDAKGEPVSDLTVDDLKVVVSAAGKQSDPLALLSTFDEDTGLGLPGDYEAPIIPTTPGDYTFHVTGSIHGQAIDETATSAADTFDAVVEPTGIQFPNALPALGDVTTRVERTDSRAQAAAASAKQASDAARGALVAGLAVGGLGVLIGLAALVLTVRRRPPA